MDIDSFTNFLVKIKENTKVSFDFENDLIPQERIDILNNYKSKSYKRASVIILCFQDNKGNISFPLIKRQIYNGVHSGQISLPGGKKDEKDKTLWKTATRELNEELGVDLSYIKKIKKLKSIYIPPSNFLVKPFF